MLPTDVVVEVRDVALRRVGQIMHHHLDLRFKLDDEGTSEWTCRVRAEDPMAVHLKEPGAGLVVTHRDPTIGLLWSGPGLPTEEAGREDPRGVVVVKGTTDDVILWNRTVHPPPGQGYDTRTGVAETVMRDYVTATLGPAAGVGRTIPGLTLGLDLGRGGQVSRSARYDYLADLLRGIAVPAGLGFRLVQAGDRLEFQVTDPTDRTGTVRLDVRNGGLSSTSATVTPDGLTHAYVAGQGDLTARTIVEVTSGDTWQQWGPWARRERFVDQRQTNDPAALEQAGLEAILDAAGGATVVAVPSDDQSMMWPTHWGLGDTITVTVGATPYAANVTSVEGIIDSGGVRIGAGIGPLRGNLPGDDLRLAQRRLERRLAALERLTGTGTVA